MMHISDNFSQEGGYCGGMKNEDFALPLVGRRRKASEAGYVAKQNNMQQVSNKRQHKKEVTT